MTLNHDNFIIELKELHSDIMFVIHRTNNEQGYYKKCTTEYKSKNKVSVYKLNIPSLWLPAFITITESELDISINHSRPGVQN